MLRCALKRLQWQLEAPCAQLCLRVGASSNHVHLSRKFSGAKMPAAGAAQLCHAKRRARGRRFVLHMIISNYFSWNHVGLCIVCLLEFLQGTAHYANIR